MGTKTSSDDVAGRCPRCQNPVAVYARGGGLRVRAHTRTRGTATGQYTTTCSVTGMDGAEALDRVLDDLERAVSRADKDVSDAEAALARMQGRAAKAREQRDEYAAKVAAIKARVAGKGGAR